MSEPNKQVQNSYPRGTGTASVPILFSLRNVQPSLVKGVAKDSAKPSSDLPSSEMAPPVAVASPVVGTLPPAPIPKLHKPGNRIYNGTIALLVVVLCVIVFRNTQLKGTSGLSPVLAGVNKTNTQVKKDETLPTSKPATLSNSKVANPSPMTLGPSDGTDSASQPKTESTSSLFGTASVSLLNPRPEPNSDKVLSIASETNPTPGSGASFPFPMKEVSGILSPPVLPPLPSRDAASSRSIANPDARELPNSNAALTSASKPRTDSIELPTTAELMLGPPLSQSSPAGPDANVAAPSNATHAVTAQESVVDTGMELTTKELIEAFQSAPVSASSTTPRPYQAMGVGASANSVPVNNSIPARSVSYTPINESASTMKPYTPISQPSLQPQSQSQMQMQSQSQSQIPLTQSTSSQNTVAAPNASMDMRDAMAKATLNNNSQLMSGQAYPPLPKEYQPIAVPNNGSLAIPAYEQFSMDSSRNIPLVSQSSLRQPIDPNANRYQGMTIQQPTATAPRSPYTPMYPSQGTVPSGTPTGYPPK